MEKQEIKKLLRQGVVEFTFTKADGSVRSMNGTTKADLLPVLDEDSTSKTHSVEPDHLVRVFDVDIQDWRSFRIDSLLTFNGKEINASS